MNKIYTIKDEVIIGSIVHTYETNGNRTLLNEYSKKMNLDIPTLYEFEKKFLNHIEKKSIYPVIEITPEFLKRFIVATSLDCQASGEGIKSLMEDTLRISVSKGSISQTLKLASKRAEESNNKEDLSKIKQGATDEIFSLRNPVLVGVDPQTTYTFLYQLSDKRDGDSWGYYLLEKNEKQSLELEQIVMDGAKGMRTGIKDAFGKDISIGYDMFHAQRLWHHIVKYYERKAYSEIKKVYKLENKKKKLKDKKSLRSIIGKISHNRIIMKEYIDIYDNFYILSNWLDEVFSLYSIKLAMTRNETFESIIELLDEFEEEKEIMKLKEFLLDKKIELLAFSKPLKDNLLVLIEKYSYEVVRLSWHQLFFSKTDSKYWQIQDKICKYLQYSEINDLQKKILDLRRSVLRASSIVEGINSLLRRYVYMHKGITQNQLNLIVFYLNHRKYRRSNIADRVNKSPAELLTGETQENWLDLLGFKLSA